MKPKILIVDDEINILQIHEQQLEDNFMPITAKNGKHALQKFKSEKEIPVVITDIEMPVMNGIELVNEIFSIKPNTRIIFVSGLKDEIENLLILNKDFFCLVKPVMPSFVSLAARLSYSSWVKEKEKGLVYNNQNIENYLDKSIIVAEDDPIILETHLSALDDFLNVIPATNGENAWNIYKNEQGNVAVVVTDIDMPVMDGLSLIKNIRAESNTTQIIAVTGILDDNLSETLLKYNVYSLPKPINPFIIKLAVYSSFSRYARMI